MVPLGAQAFPEEALLLQPEGETPRFRLGCHNYYVLSRYNPSHHCVLALFLLSPDMADGGTGRGP